MTVVNKVSANISEDIFASVKSSSGPVIVVDGNAGSEQEVMIMMSPKVFDKLYSLAMGE